MKVERKKKNLRKIGEIGIFDPLWHKQWQKFGDCQVTKWCVQRAAILATPTFQHV